MTDQHALILVVDDNPTNIKVIFDVLEEADFRVLVAKSGKSALEKLQVVSPDLILLDVMMPGLDGFAVCQQLKADPKTAAIPVIFMTALTATTDKVKGIDLGAVDYITKPFQQEEVLARIRLHLKLRQVTQTLDIQNHQLQQLTQELEQRVQERTTALRESEECLRQLTENITSVFWLTNLEMTTILYVSSACEQIWGYSRESIYRSPDLWLQAIHPEDRPQVLAALNQKVHGTYDQEYRIIRNDGTVRWVRDRAFPIREQSGHVYRIAGIVDDITDKRQIEETLRLQERAIASSKNGIVITDSRQPHYPISFVNQAFERMTGYPAVEIIGQNCRFLQGPDREQPGLTVLRHALKEQQSCTVILRNYRKDGSLFWNELSIAPIYDAQGNLTHYIGIQTDITERKQAEVNLQQTNEELMRATRLKDEFLATMSHELRTPLNAVLGMTEGLQEEIFGTLNNEQRKALQTIERSGTHLLELINDILDVAKIESGQIELTLTPTTVTALCQSSMTFIKQQALKKRIQIEMNLAHNLPDVVVDERRIRQVLINLLNNAVKFTPEGGHITLEVNDLRLPANPDDVNSLPQNVLRITVIDTGIGIAPTHLSKLFQPFFQIDSTLNRKYEGTGLGLALVKRIVELHSGRVSVTSEVGNGSRFMVDIPRPATTPSLQSSSPQAACIVHPTQSEQSVSPLILLAEDDEANISTMSSYLQAKGYRLLLAKTGQEAIALALAKTPDLILMDIHMSGMDGLETIRQIHHSPALVRVPILAIAALAMAGDREQCLAAGAVDYLSKPVKLKDLFSRIQQLLV